MGITGALAYSQSHGGRGFCAMQDGKIVEVDAPDLVGDINSATKGLTAATFATLMRDGYLESLDVPVSTHIAAWAAAGLPKLATTYRELLQMRSGLAGGVPGSNVSYAQAIAYPMPAQDVGTFKYGPIPYLVAAAGINAMVRPRGFTDALDYITKRLLAPNGIAIDHCDSVGPLQPNLAHGVHMSSRALAKFGELMRTAPWLQSLSVAGPHWFYGTGVWRTTDLDGGVAGTPDPSLTLDGFVAAGAGNQRCFVIPALNLVCARLGQFDQTWSDTEFVRRLMG